MASQGGEGDEVDQNASKRARWATTRVKSVGKAANRRASIKRRFHKNGSASEKKRVSAGTDSSNESPPAKSPEQEAEEETPTQEKPRTIFFNQPLPDDMKDEDGRPLAKYARNKIRTARYTPLTFVPMNLWYQFHNVANIYFLFPIVLGFFTIFGVPNPVLNAFPLLFVLCVTAVKDAIEDQRRTALDIEINNSPLHRLVDWENVNSSEDDVSLWRRIKKGTSHGLAAIWANLKQKLSKKSAPDGDAEGGSDEGRSSFDTIRSSKSRMSRQQTQEDIQMTSVSSPTRSSHLEGQNLSPDGGRSSMAIDRKNPFRHSLQPPPNKPIGSLIDPHKEAPGRARFMKDFWKNVHVGDFVRIYNNDQLPADIVILATSDPDGACYVETKNLDGETNLKVRQALQSGRMIKHARDCEKANFVIESEPPHSNLYSYNGAARWTERDPNDPEKAGEERFEAISINNLLLRGCNLRNTDWVLGVVVFTGQETKTMMNAGITISKRSRITRDLNWDVLYNFVILFIMCMIAAIGEGVTWGEPKQSLEFYEFGSIGGTPALNGFVTFWAALILLQNLVPISLYISLEIIRTAQAFFIYSDTYMYYEKLDYPCTPKSWNISDDLGQVEYIFSDKTGTLTQNVMEFKKCSVNGVPYGEAYTEAQAGIQRRQGIDVEAESAKALRQIAIDRVRMVEHIRRIHDNPFFRDDGLTFVAPDFVEDLDGHAGPDQKDANAEFLLALSLCHSVLTERKPGDPPTIEFKAQSPDEAALVATARDCGYTFLDRTNEGLILDVHGEQTEYQLLNTLEFNSTRKRMSAIIRMPDNRIILYCKGADSIIYSRLKKGEQQALRKTTAEHLEMFAREGLRTLCIARKEISEEDYQSWNKQYEVAAAAVMDREEKLEAISDVIERDLWLMGGTAIEDRLQDGVPDTIQLLGRAGIKLWVLTGDKVETAINIGFSCNLLDNDMDLLLFRIEEEGGIDAARAELDKHLSIFGLTGSDEEVAHAKKDHSAPAPTHAVVVDGDALKILLEDELRQKFLILCKQCKSVLCCRVSPSQKASVVRLVKNSLDVMTLSIGDGANDVAMIQEADVGVGIVGEEGRQAAMSADYAIGQFRFLQRLVLVHGRWSYRRLGETIANFFYKNVVWTVALFWYQLYNSFDITYLFDYTYVLFYTVAFSSLPVIFMGILDQDVSDKVCLAVPQLYRRGIERKEWTQTKFWLYMVDGAYQSLMCFFLVFFLFNPARPVSHTGMGIEDTRRIGVYVATSAVTVVNVYILMNMYRWDWLMCTLVAFSVLLVWLWTGAYTSFTTSSLFYKAAAEVYGEPTFWATFILIIIVCLLPRFAIKAFQKIFLPYDVDIVREQIRQGKFQYLDNVSPDEAAKKAPKPETDGNAQAAEGSRPMMMQQKMSMDEEARPIYPPSLAQTSVTANHRSQNGSDGTDYISGPRISVEHLSRPHSRTALSPIESPRSRPLSQVSTGGAERPRPSFDRMRSSMDVVRPSFEACRDMSTAAGLTRMESSYSDKQSTSSPDRREFPLSRLR